MKAVVLGGTGAVGESLARHPVLSSGYFRHKSHRIGARETGLELVGQLLQSGAWSSVTTVGRREVQVPAAYEVCK